MLGLNHRSDYYETETHPVLKEKEEKERQEMKAAGCTDLQEYRGSETYQLTQGMKIDGELMQMMISKLDSSSLAQGTLWGPV